jgi:hypothetical protein
MGDQAVETDQEEMEDQTTDQVEEIGQEETDKDQVVVLIGQEEMDKDQVVVLIDQKETGKDQADKVEIKDHLQKKDTKLGLKNDNYKSKRTRNQITNN